jgi:hypothetical protein
MPDAKAIEPTTQPLHDLADEAPPELGLEALLDVLVERGVIDRDAWVDAVRRLAKQRTGE